MDFISDTNHFLYVSQVSLEETLQDENPKLDPVTAVYMVGRNAMLSLCIRIRHFKLNFLSDIKQAIRDWADVQHTTEVSYERAVTLLVSKGHSREVRKLSSSQSCFSFGRRALTCLRTQVLDACLDEYASLDVWVLDGERNITFVD